VTVGLSATQAAALINIYRATTITAPANVYLRLHTGDPGSAGTANASAETTRKALTFAAPSAGSSTASAVSWASWSAGTETISHISIWDASSGGNFLQSGALAASKTVANGDTLNVTPTVAYTPIAA
jgi:hypothetical protein